MHKQYLLTSENVDVVSEEIFAFMQSFGMPQRHIIRTRLTAETVLLAWIERVGEGVPFVLETGKQFKRPYVRLMLEGERTDPLKFSVEDALSNGAADYYNSVLTNTGLSVTYKYRNSVNTVDIRLPMVSLGVMGLTVVSIVLSFLFSFALRWIAPGFAGVIATEFISPVFNAMVNFLTGIASFMIFFCVVNGVCSMGDIAMLNSVGMRLMKLVLRRNFTALSLAMVAAVFVFRILDVESGLNMNFFVAVFRTLVGIMPNNLIEPFVTGNSLQVIFIGFFTGIFFLILDERVRGVIAIIKECSTLFMTAINYFCSTIPLIVFLSLTNVLLVGRFQAVLGTSKALLEIAAVSCVYMTVETLFTCRSIGSNVWQYMKSVVPIVGLALRTGDTTGCYTLIEQNCIKMRVNKKFLNFALPFGQILINTGTVIVFVGMIMGLSEVCGFRFTLAQLIICALTHYILTIAAPPIPGGMIAVMGVLNIQAGLPEYCLALCIAVNVFLDMAANSVNVCSSMNILTYAAAKLHLTDEKE